MFRCPSWNNHEKAHIWMLSSSVNGVTNILLDDAANSPKRLPRAGVRVIKVRVVITVRVRRKLETARYWNGAGSRASAITIIITGWLHQTLAECGGVLCPWVKSTCRNWCNLLFNNVHSLSLGLKPSLQNLTLSSNSFTLSERYGPINSVFQSDSRGG
jgi:hypothetical protein